jgi:tetratricopeptide (TPR) repeat protein
MSIEKLKEKARRHEQKEEWQKALDEYKVAIKKLAEEDQPEATVNSLERALKVEYEIEDELLGIYYYLASASEDLGKQERAVDLYEKVFSLVINFGDVTDRFRDLR